MKDKEFLQWIFGRLEEVHNENRYVDYMMKFKNIIKEYDPEKITPNRLNIYNES